MPGLHCFLLFFQIVKIVGPNGKLISSEQLRLIHILLQGNLEGKEGDGVLAMGTFNKFPKTKKITQRASPVVALT
jgi:hypothetical protein